MELKFVVSVVLYYVYVYLKTREKKEKTIKQVFLSFDLFLFLIPLLVFIEDDLTKMALFLGIFMALALVVVYKKENPKEIMKKKNQILILHSYNLYHCPSMLKQAVPSSSCADRKYLNISNLP